MRLPETFQPAAVATKVLENLEISSARLPASSLDPFWRLLVTLLLVTASIRHSKPYGRKSLRRGCAHSEEGRSRLTLFASMVRPASALRGARDDGAHGRAGPPDRHRPRPTKKGRRRGHHRPGQTPGRRTLIVALQHQGWVHCWLRHGTRAGLLARKATACGILSATPVRGDAGASTGAGRGRLPGGISAVRISLSF